MYPSEKRIVSIGDLLIEVVNSEAPLSMICAHPSRTFSFDIVMHMTTAGQRLGKRIPEITI
jgi:hypothetical protein